MALDDAAFQENERTAEAGNLRYAELGGLTLESGARLPDVRIAYETFGEFTGDNAVLISHALTGNAHAIGWWERIVGAGKAIDTDRYFVIGNNLLGSCSGSTGPGTLAQDGKPYGSRFPVLTIEDQVAAQKALLKHLGVDTLFAVVGGSTGGFLALSAARSMNLNRVVVTASAARQGAQQIALNEAARQAIMRDPKWRGGDYGDDPPSNGLAVARMIGHIGYLSGDALETKFGRSYQHGQRRYTLEPDFAVESYLNYQGDKFNERFDANSFLYLTRAANYFDLDSLTGATAKFLFIAFTSDSLYPPECSQALFEMAHAANCEAELAIIESPFGHDSFLLDGERQGQVIREFLSSD